MAAKTPEKKTEASTSSDQATSPHSPYELSGHVPQPKILVPEATALVQLDHSQIGAAGARSIAYWLQPFYDAMRAPGDLPEWNEAEPEPGEEQFPE